MTAGGVYWWSRLARWRDLAVKGSPTVRREPTQIIVRYQRRPGHRQSGWVAVRGGWHAPLSRIRIRMSDEVARTFTLYAVPVYQYGRRELPLTEPPHFCSVAKQTPRR